MMHLLAHASAAATSPTHTMNGPLQILGPNPRAKPQVPSRMGAATSPFRGVSSQGHRWRARICVDKIEYTIGDFDTEEQAAMAYDLEAIRFKKLKNLNYVYKNINDYLSREAPVITHTRVPGDKEVGGRIVLMATSASASRTQELQTVLDSDMFPSRAPKKARRIGTRVPDAYQAPKGPVCSRMASSQGSKAPSTNGSSSKYSSASTAFTPMASPVESFDDYCYMCGGAGDLACCDTCPRVFHLGCLGVDAVDPHKWSCPVCMGTMPPRPDYRGNPFAPPYGYSMPMPPPPMHAMSAGMQSGSDPASRHQMPPLGATMMPQYGDPSRYPPGMYMQMPDYGFPYGMNPMMMYGNGFGGMPYGMMPPHPSNGMHPPPYAMSNPSDSAPRPAMDGGMHMYSNGYSQAEPPRKPAGVPRGGPANESELDAVSALVSVRAAPVAPPGGNNKQAELLDFMTKPPLRDVMDDVQRKALHQIVLAGHGSFMDAFVKTAAKYAMSKDTSDLHKDVLRICDAWVNKLPAPAIPSPRPSSTPLPSPSFPQLAGVKRPRSPLETSETTRDGHADRGFVNGFPPPTRRIDTSPDETSPLTTGVGTPAARAASSQPPTAVPEATHTSS